MTPSKASSRRGFPVLADHVLLLRRLEASWLSLTVFSWWCLAHIDWSRPSWKDVDLDRKVLRVTATLSYVAGEFIFPQPKTSRARRSVDLPAFVVAFLKRQRKAQLERRLFYGETWTDYDVVLDDVAGAPFAPWSVSADFRRLSARWSCRERGSTI